MLRMPLIQKRRIQRYVDFCVFLTSWQQKVMDLLILWYIDKWSDQDLSRHQNIHKMHLLCFFKGELKAHGRSSCTWRVEAFTIMRCKLARWLNYLHISIYIWIGKNSCLFLPTAQLSHNLYTRMKVIIYIVIIISISNVLSLFFFKTYLLCFQHLDSETRNQVFPEQSFQGCAGHFGLCKQKFSEVQTLLICIHCKRSPQWPVMTMNLWTKYQEDIL